MEGDSFSLTNTELPDISIRQGKISYLLVIVLIDKVKDTLEITQLTVLFCLVGAAVLAPMSP